MKQMLKPLSGSISRGSPSLMQREEKFRDGPLPTGTIEVENESNPHKGKLRKSFFLK